mgnify:FL=1
MRKYRVPDKKQFKNQFVLASLCGICVLLIGVIFFISNHAAAKSSATGDTVTAAQVEEAYAFLNQSQAVTEAAKQLDEPCTYGAYQQFLEYLNVWKAANLSNLLDWEQQKNEPLSAWQLSQTRAQVAELFETGTYDPVQPAVPAVQELADVHMPEVDASTKIRVLLLQDGACVGDEVYVSANEPYTVTFQGVTRQKKEHKVVNIGRLGLQIGETAVVSSEAGKVYLADQDGARDTLGYCGDLRITRYADGYAIVNVVPIEDYLCGVVQSEMPAYFETEALKAQVVCARTYIVLQLMQDNYPQYGADVDDSVQYQVYNRTAPDERVVAAVREVYGQILAKDDLPAETYFFSTSVGVTSGRELWGLPQLDYLQPVRGNADDRSVPDLSDEDAFRAYISEQVASDYDSDSSYYRWQALLQPDEELEVRLKVLERNASGAVSRLRIRTQNGERELTNEHEIRRALGRWLSELRDKDGEKLPAGDLLPSVYFYVQPVEDGIVLSGGGLGHGIGMSQYGANGCAQAGMDMEQILQTYYPGTALYQLYTKDE